MPAWAQDPYYINYAIGDGLPSDNVYSVFEDDNGLLWFTTDVGVVKFNSKSFELFNTDDGLSDNEVFRITKDSKGRMWMHTLNGKLSYLRNDSVFNADNSTIAAQVRGTGYIIDVHEQNGKVFLCFRNGDIFIIDSTDNVSKVEITSEVGNDEGQEAFFYTLNSESVVGVGAETYIVMQPVSQPSKVYHVNNRHFFSSVNQVYVVDHDSVFNYLDIEDAIQVTDIYFDGRYTWVCSKNGIYRYLGKKCTAHFFAGDAVSGIIKDREGSYWVTTLNRGVLYVPSMQVLQLLPGKKISRLGAHGGTLWIGGSENDYYIKTGDQLSERHLPADWNMNKISNFRFYDDRIYVVARSGLVAISNNNTQTFQFNINDILEDDDRIFVATTFTARIDRKELTPGLRYYINKRAILWKRTNVLCKDNNSNIWIGTNFGLYQYHIHTATPELINMGDMYDDLSVSIEDIYYDAEQNVLLVATASKGLLLLQNGKIIRKIRTAEGLNNNSVNTIKKIREHIYLAGTNDGLNKIVLDTAKPKVYNYNTRIGIRNKRIRDIEAIDGIVYLATDDGVLYFSMQDLKPLSVQPICSILDVRIDKSSWKGEKMNYKENDISISFNGISYIDRGNLLYYYRFTDYESKWYTTKETQVNYKDLPPGSYTFELYCVNGLGNRSPVQSVAFEILPPFWVEIWFRLLLGLVLVGLIFGVVRYRFKRQEARNAAEMVSIQAERDKARLETQMLELEQRSLRMQMNPHFIFNALNTIKGYYTEGNDVKASSYISKFSRLLRMILENEGQNTTLENEVAMLKLYLDLNKIRYQDKFSYEIQVDKELIQSDIMIPNLLLQPLVENALIHGLANKEEHGHLLVSFNRSAHKMICTVQDDGIGRAEAARQKGRALHQSKALSIVKDRLRLFSSRSTLDIYDLEQDGQPVGTKVVIAIPV